MPTRTHDQNLDSLLDTMANVVGILVVLMAVTQLSLGDAVERLRERAGERAAATPDDLAEIVGQRDELLAESAQARSRIERYVDAPSFGMTFAEARPLLDAYESLAGPSAAAGDLPSDAEIENVRVAVARLEGAVRETEGDAESLLAILAEPAARAQPRTIRLPDPRPVPSGLEREFFFCRGGQVHVVDLRALEETLITGVRAATGHLSQVTVERADIPWIVNHFKKEAITDQGYRWVFDPALNAELVPTSAIAPGEDLAMLARPGSRTAAALAALDPRRQYVRFFVWPDSFDAYLAARQLAEERGLRVGWQEMRAGDNLRFDVLNTERSGRRLLD